MKVLFTAIAVFVSVALYGQAPIPLEKIETPPAFRECNQESSRDEMQECFFGAFASYVQNNLVYPPDAILKQSNSRVYVSFIIDDRGKVNDVMARGEHPSLEEEAIRLVTLMPKLKPGMHMGEKVSTRINIPIQFSMPPARTPTLMASSRPEQFNDSIASILEKVPVFPGCENLSNSEARECFSDMMREHIRKNFRYPRMAQLKNIQGTVYANFTIEIDGSIGEINLIAPHQLLADETIRILKLLPNITPAIQKGRKVRVPYAFPITFRLVSPN